MHHLTPLPQVKNFVPTSLALEVSPKNFKAAVELEAVVTKKNADNKLLDYNKTFVEKGVPYASIVIPHIFKLGLTAKFGIVGSVMAWGSATVTVGARMTLPDTGKVKLDLVNYKKSGVAGFHGAHLKPVQKLKEASINANVRAGLELALTFGIEVLGATGIEAKLGFGVPVLNVNATAGYGMFLPHPSKT